MSPPPPPAAPVPLRPLTTRYAADDRHGVPPLVDVWLPEGTGPSPSVVVVHGGGFITGWRRMPATSSVTQRLAQAGFVSASFEYRRLPDAGHIDHAIDDTAEMFAWWARQSDRFWFDPARTHVVGLSAGAALAFLALNRQPIANKVVSVYGVTDFTIVPGATTTLPHRLMFGGSRPPDWRERSPIHAFKQPVPLLMMHGTKDRVVVPAHSERMAEDRRARGLPVALSWYTGEGHGFLKELGHRGHDEIIQFLKEP